MKELDFKRFATQIRIGVVEEMRARGFGHIGGSLSVCDVLSVLYEGVMRYDPKDPKWPERDKLVVSKGHAGPAVYATLALKGFFPYDMLASLNQPGTNLPSHCDKNKTPGVDMTTGSLGQGTSLAVGLALGDRLAGRDSRTFLIVGDGELNEGQCWEAAMFTAAKKLTNITWIIDDNKRQLDGWTANVLNPFNFEEKFRAFGFDAVTVKGDDVMGLYEALTAPVGDKPKAIVLDSVKGAGIDEVANTFGNHSMSPNAETCDKWLAELRAELAAME
ncbi:MAG: transketolase [Mailhella sp.]|nr:transketolase [Mailhella sp.]